MIFMIRFIYVFFLLIAFLISPIKVHAKVSFGVIDVISRVDISNLDDSKVQTFHVITDQLISKIFKDIPTIVIDDATNDSNQSRLDEIAFQLSQGNSIEFKDSTYDYIVYGYLRNLTLSEGHRLITNSESIRVDLSIRIVDVRTGKCVFATSATGTSKASHLSVLKYKFAGRNIDDKDLSNAFENATDKIVAKLKNSI